MSYVRGHRWEYDAGMTERNAPSMSSGLPPPITIPIVFVHGILSGAVTRGEDIAPFLAQADIPFALLEDIGARVTAAQYVALFRALIELRADEGLGFFSRPLRTGSLALMLRSALEAPNLETAIRRLAKAFGLLQDDVELELLRDRDTAGLALRFHPSDTQPPVFMHEFLLRVFWRIVAWLAGGRLPAVRVDLAFPAPPHSASYAAIFPSQLRFLQMQTALWFDAAWLSKTHHRSERLLREFLVHAQANVILPPRPERVTSERIREYLLKTVPAWPGLAVASQALHMSPATLQRRLAFEGTAFQALKDELRRDLAIARLSGSQASFAAVAQELGFTDSAAFQRAFKRWVGSTPGAYRKQHM